MRYKRKINKMLKSLELYTYDCISEKCITFFSYIYLSYKKMKNINKRQFTNVVSELSFCV